MAFIDDATNRAWGHFYAYEGVWPEMDVLEGYVGCFGLPQSLYLDRHSTYKTTREATTEELLRGQEAQTQFERAAGEMEIRIIYAYSPQAKGRIERLFGTLQDRLVKEMRLAGVATRGMRRRPAQVLEHPDGRIVIRFNGRDLLIREVLQETARPALPRQPKAEKPKTGKYIPPADHPWRRSNKIIHREWAQGIF